MSDLKICKQCGLEILAHEKEFCGSHINAGACRDAGERIRDQFEAWKCDSHQSINRRGCVNCGAAVCCPPCCRIEKLKAELRQAENERDTIDKAYKALKEGS